MRRHVAAASFALELDRTGDARFWLERTPERLRGWEHGYLDGQSSERRSPPNTSSRPRRSRTLWRSPRHTGGRSTSPSRPKRSSSPPLPEVRLHLDADTSRKALHRALTDRGHDVTRTPNAWMPLDAIDEEQLLGATAQGRALFTFNIRDFVVLARHYEQQGGWAAVPATGPMSQGYGSSRWSHQGNRWR